MDCVMSVTGTGTRDSASCHVEAPIDRQVDMERHQSPAAQVRAGCSGHKNHQTQNQSRSKWCHAGRRAALCAARILFSFEHPFLRWTCWGVMQRQKGRWFRGFSARKFHISLAWSSWSSLVFSFSCPMPLYLGPSLWSSGYHICLPCMKNPYTSSQTSAYSRNDS